MADKLKAEAWAVRVENMPGVHGGNGPHYMLDLFDCPWIGGEALARRYASGDYKRYGQTARAVRVKIEEE